MVKSCYPFLASLKSVTFATTLTDGDAGARVMLPVVKVFSKKVTACLAVPVSATYGIANFLLAVFSVA